LQEAIGIFLRPALALGSKDRRVRWTPLLLAACAVLMSFDPSATLIDRFDSARDCLARLFPHARRCGGSYRGFSKALAGRGPLEELSRHLRGQMREMAGAHWLREGWCAFAADGSKIDAPRTRANRRGLGRAGRKGSPPQMALTTLWHMGTGLPWAWRVGKARSSERGHLRRMLPLLPEHSLLVLDAGFIGYDLLRQVFAAGHSVLLRVGSNARLLRKLGWHVEERQDTVYLWPARARANGRGRRKTRRGTPLTLRLIRVRGDRNKTVHLLTDVLEQSRLSAESAAVLYRLRWGVEVFFRSLKQQLQRRKMCCRRPHYARAELDWSMTGLWLMGLAGVQKVIAAGHDPLSWSVALTLRCFRREMRRMHALRPASCRRGTANAPAALDDCRKDTYQRTGRKHSLRWPHKKKDHPPMAPIITMATPRQIQQAHKLREQLLAA
jgi:hypothetical protein